MKMQLVERILMLPVFIIAYLIGSIYQNVIDGFKAGRDTQSYES